MIYRQTWRVVWNEECVLTDLWDYDNPAREFLLARRVYAICSKVVWLVEEISARELLLARRVYV